MRSRSHTLPSHPANSYHRAYFTRPVTFRKLHEVIGCWNISDVVTGRLEQPLSARRVGP